MATKTSIPHNEIEIIFSQYDLGRLIHTAVLLHGSVQTNHMIHTSRGKYVFRLYQNRTKESVLFERDLLIYLVEHSYPCSAPMKNTQGTYVGLYHHKPYMVFEFLEGYHVEEPNIEHWQQLVEYAARLQKVAQKFHSPFTPHRWNYDPGLCLKLAQTEVTKSNNENSRRKLAWLVSELATLDLPSTLPKGICHCDFHYSNVLFRDDLFVALLDFDDANYTYLQFDLVGLIEYWAWPSIDNILDVKKARTVVKEYMQHRSLSLVEQQHLFDVYKLSILFDSVWFFNRGNADDFYEKRKVDALNSLGRQALFDLLFHE